MERRGCGLGCIIAWLGLVMSCCLAPYLISSIYSIVTAVLQVPAAPNWLWGDWISTIVDASSALYMFMAEGPICCVGSIGLLIVILGLVLIISSVGQSGDDYDDQEYDEDYGAGEIEFYEDEYDEYSVSADSDF